MEELQADTDALCFHGTMTVIRDEHGSRWLCPFDGGRCGGEMFFSSTVGLPARYRHICAKCGFEAVIPKEKFPHSL